MTEDEFRATCRSELRKPYIFGADGPEAYDCSGFAVWALSLLHISTGGHRSSRSLHRHFVDEGNGDPVQKADVGLGDLCFYTNAEGRICHVTVGWGGGEVIEAGKGDEEVDTEAKARARGAEVMISDIDRHTHFLDATRPRGLPWR